MSFCCLPLFGSMTHPMYILPFVCVCVCVFLSLYLSLSLHIYTHTIRALPCCFLKKDVQSKVDLE
jgi:hypothetical protein